MSVEKNGTMLRELGNKLANFRKKLALAVGQKKITQPEFGEMFGGYSSRQITSYESGEVDPPGSMLYLIWKSGNSIDGIFNEEPVTNAGKEIAAKLYQTSTRALDDTALDRALREANIDTQLQTSPITETSLKTSGKPKASHYKARTIKKR